MKQIIKDVLNLHGEMNVNLASDAARDVIAIEIIEKLKKKGFYTKYRKPEWIWATGSQNNEWDRQKNANGNLENVCTWT